MKTSIVLNIVLAVALLVLGGKLFFGKQAAPAAAEPASAEDAVMENILTRASVRSYQDKAIEEEKIEKLLRAGMAAPTAGDKRPWHFVVVTDYTVREKLAATNPYATMALDAPLDIVVCGDTTNTFPGEGKDFWVQDLSAATENILLAAHAMGLGAVWTGTYPIKERQQITAEVLGLPDHLIPLATICIGYPEKPVEPKQKFDEKNISYNTYGGAATTLKHAAATPQEKPFHAFDIEDDFNHNPFTIFGNHGLLLAAGNKDGFNAMTIGWGAMGTLWRKPAVTVYVAEKRYTHEFMERSKYFTVMRFKDNSIVDYMGTHSGRDGDKAKALGLHTLYTENGTPYFAEADLVIECETMYAEPFDKAAFRNQVPKKLYADFPAGVHSFYIGEVVKALKR